MLSIILLVILIADAVVLGTVILLQAGQGGGLAAMGGGASTDTFFGGRQAVTILTKLSWWCGGIFLFLAMILAGLGARGGAPRSVLEQAPGQATPVVPGQTSPLPLDVPDEGQAPPPSNQPEQQGRGN